MNFICITLQLSYLSRRNSVRTKETKNESPPETPRQVFKRAGEFLPSVPTTPSIATDESFVVMKQPNLGSGSDSFLGPDSDHSSFLKSTETSFVAFPTKRRRSIRRSDYDSLLLSESKRISNYSSLFQSSEMKQLSPDVLQSLQTQPKLTDLSLSSISGSRMDSTLQESEIMVNEPKEKREEEKMDEMSVGVDDGTVGNESNGRENVQPSMEVESEEEEEEEEEEEKSKEMSKSEEPKSIEEEEEEQEEPEEEQEEEEEEEEKSEQKEEEEEEKSEQKEEEPEEEQEEEEEESQHSVASIESGNSLSMGDIPFANSQEERTLRELLIPSQPSQLGETTSLLEPSLMPPPSSSLSSRLRIPNRTKIHTHRKSSEFLARLLRSDP